VSLNALSSSNRLSTAGCGAERGSRLQQSKEREGSTCSGVSELRCVSRVLLKSQMFSSTFVSNLTIDLNLFKFKCLMRQWFNRHEHGRYETQPPTSA
jgi:hypothetical protein